MSDLSRRRFVELAGVGLAAASLAQAQTQSGKPAAGEGVDRTKKNQRARSEN